MQQVQAAQNSTRPTSECLGIGLGLAMTAGTMVPAGIADEIADAARHRRANRVARLDGEARVLLKCRRSRAETFMASIEPGKYLAVHL